VNEQLRHFRAAVETLPVRPRTLGDLIDAAALASHRFRHCSCRDDCPHDGAAIDAEAEVRGFLTGKLGLSQDQMDALGGML
jgi:hypothetical protein